MSTLRLPGVFNKASVAQPPSPDQETLVYVPSGGVRYSSGITVPESMVAVVEAAAPETMLASTNIPPSLTLQWDEVSQVLINPVPAELSQINLRSPEV